ncbi:hypothetical protein GE061_004822 [Apolygus lucorum]|uniref:Uncharacterized protein n=1 Tax=Apolygus lucorum TaxID=248454 RepID=A0A6A4J0T3_APOLU|nr:hypothetical protein GE061_004822 [Apolygus lucorum]
MAKAPSKSSRKPLRRSGRIRARNAMIDTMNLVSDEGRNTDRVEQDLPISRRGIKREIVEEGSVINTVNESREDQSNSNFMEFVQEGKSDDDSDASVIPTAKLQRSTEYRANSSFSGPNGFYHSGRADGPLLKLRNPPLQSFPLPTISEMLAVPAGDPTLEQQPIDLEKCNHRKHLRRSPSGNWSQDGSRPPSECGYRSEGIEMSNVPAKRFQRNCGGRFRNMNLAGTPLQRYTTLTTKKKQPSRRNNERNSRTNGSESDSEYESEGDDELSGTSYNHESDHSSGNRQTARKSKLSSKKEKIHDKVRPSCRAKPVCKTCGGVGHRNIIDDRTKVTISRALFRYGLSD